MSVVGAALARVSVMSGVARFSQHSIDWPSSVQPLVNSGCGQPRGPRPVGHGPSDAVPRHIPVASPIVTLLGMGSPATVPGLVVTAVVDPIETVLWGGHRPHVIQKGPERCCPPIAYRHSPDVVRVHLAPALHTSPCPIFGRSWHALPRASVRRASLRK